MDTTAKDSKCAVCGEAFPENKRYWIKGEGPFCQHCATTYYERKATVDIKTSQEQT